MSIASSIALSGLAAASLRLQASANNIANAAPGPLSSSIAAGDARASVDTASLRPATLFDRGAPHADSFGAIVTGPNLDLAGEILEHLIASTTFAAVAQIIRADPKMIKSLLDINA